LKPTSIICQLGVNMWNYNIEFVPKQNYIYLWESPRIYYLSPLKFTRAASVALDRLDTNSILQRRITSGRSKNSQINDLWIFYYTLHYFVSRKWFFGPIFVSFPTTARQKSLIVDFQYIHILSIQYNFWYYYIQFSAEILPPPCKPVRVKILNITTCGIIWRTRRIKEKGLKIVRTPLNTFNPPP